MKCNKEEIEASAALSRIEPELNVRSQITVLMTNRQRSNRRKAESKRRRAVFSLLLTAGLLVLVRQADADRFPAGCGLPSGDGSGYEVDLVANVLIAAAGQVVEYKVVLENTTTDDFGDPSCAVTNVHASLRFPNGVVVPITTKIALDPGDPAIICPGDLRCNPLPVGPTGFGYPYVVSLADVTNITFAPECPFPPGSTPAIIAELDFGAEIRGSDAGSLTVSDARCRPLLINRNSPVAGDLNGDGIVDRNELSTVLSNYWAHSPIYITNPATVGGGKFQFALTNDNGWNFTVQASIDGVNWTNLSDRASPVYQFYDPAATNAPVRLYRLRIQ